MTNEMIEIRPGTEVGAALLVQDARGLVGDVGKLAGKLGASASEGLLAARTTVEARLSDAIDRVDAVRLAVSDGARSAADATNRYVRENPWKILAAALAGGLVAGFMLRRR